MWTAASTLATFGAAIKQSTMTWEDGLRALHDHDLQDLRRPIKGYEGNEGVFGSIELSFRTLSQEDQLAFTRCAIFPEDLSVPVSALSALWHDLLTERGRDRELRRRCQRLEDASLWRRNSDPDEPVEPRFQIHDLVSDYLHSCLDDPATAHRAIVAGYRQHASGGWATLPSHQGYGWRF